MKQSKLVVYAALGLNAAIAVSKFVAAALTGSSSMLSEGFHSSVDTADQALLLLGMRRSRRPAAHPAAACCGEHDVRTRPPYSNRDYAASRLRAW